VKPRSNFVAKIRKMCLKFVSQTSREVSQFSVTVPLMERKSAPYTESLSWENKAIPYLRWKRRTGSLRRSEMSRSLPFLLTSGCFRTNNHPTCAKKNPRFALWGSASVSENLWWTLWSRAHSMTSFFNWIAEIAIQGKIIRRIMNELTIIMAGCPASLNS
jgi:hypothetical protein